MADQEQPKEEQVREFKNKKEEEYYEKVMEHKELVRKYMTKIITSLKKRADSHDDSKLQEPEFSLIAKEYLDFKKIEYGTEKYEENLKKMEPILDIHYLKNSHHPEFTEKNEEQWKNIKDFEGYYKISNFGIIKRIERIQVRKNGWTNTLSEQVVTPNLTPKGYLRIQLTKDGIKKNIFIHRLVAEAFVPNPENKEYVNHINGDKQDNYYKNLEWVTSSENLQHSYDLGLKRPAYKYIVKCITLDIITLGINEMVKILHEKGYKKVNPSGIYNCITGKNNTHFDLTFESYNIEDCSPKSNIRFMTLIDLLEMCIDIFISAKNKDKKIDSKMVILKHRAKHVYGEEIARILENTLEIIEKEFEEKEE